MKDTKKILPNSFLIGAQKSATTSVFNWLSQHPNICAPTYLKDLDFFTNDDFYIKKGFSFLSKQYYNFYNNEKIILQGSVHYIFFENAIRRIKKFNPNAKFILILRNPIERAISAYEYAVKFNYEHLNIDEAFRKEDERMRSTSIRELSELTYKNHGLYYKQIQIFLKYFKKTQLHVLTFEEVSVQPKKTVESIFSFFDVDTEFVPNFSNLNNTGEVKNKRFQKIAFGNHRIRNFFVKNILKNIFSEDYVSKVRWKLIHFNTKQTESDYLSKVDVNLREELKLFFKDDIEHLELFLKKDLSHWKK